MLRKIYIVAPVQLIDMFGKPIQLERTAKEGETPPKINAAQAYSMLVLNHKKWGTKMEDQKRGLDVLKAFGDKAAGFALLEETTWKKGADILNEEELDQPPIILRQLLEFSDAWLNAEKVDPNAYT